MQNTKDYLSKGLILWVVQLDLGTKIGKNEPKVTQ